MQPTTPFVCKPLHASEMIAQQEIAIWEPANLRDLAPAHRCEPRSVNALMNCIYIYMVSSICHSVWQALARGKSLGTAIRVNVPSIHNDRRIVFKY